MTDLATSGPRIETPKVTADVLALHTGISKATIHRLATQGAIPCYSFVVGRKVIRRFDVAEVLAAGVDNSRRIARRVSSAATGPRLLRLSSGRG